MEQREHPLIVEHHEGYKDVYQWKGLPGGYNKYELYGFIGVVIFVVLLQFIDGIRSIEAYIGGFFLLTILAGVYKGFQVGLQSIGFKPYNPTYFTRLTPDFFIWSNDPAIEITKGMRIMVRPVSASTNNEGAVYIYSGDSRDIAFMSDNDANLLEFAKLLEIYYDLKNDGEIYS